MGTRVDAKSNRDRAVLVQRVAFHERRHCIWLWAGSSENQKHRERWDSRRFLLRFHLQTFFVVNHPIKVGISDSYIEEIIDATGRYLNISEYDRVNFTDQITNFTTIRYLDQTDQVEKTFQVFSWRLSPLPTCNIFKNCSACVNAKIAFNCSWCASLNRCSDGVDRGYQDWRTSGEPNILPAQFLLKWLDFRMQSTENYERTTMSRRSHYTKISSRFKKGSFRFKHYDGSSCESKGSHDLNNNLNYGIFSHNGYRNNKICHPWKQHKRRCRYSWRTQIRWKDWKGNSKLNFFVTHH